MAEAGGGRVFSIFGFLILDPSTLDPRLSTHSRGTAGSALSGRLCFLAFPAVAARNRNRQKHPPETDHHQVSGAHAKGRVTRRKNTAGATAPTAGRLRLLHTVASACVTKQHRATQRAVSRFRSFAPSLGPEQQQHTFPGPPALPPVCTILGLPPSPFTFQRASVIKNLLPDGCQPRFLLQPTLVAPSRLDSIACVAKRKSRDLIHLQIQQTRPRSKHTLTCRPR